MVKEQIKSVAADFLQHPSYGLSKMYWKTFGILHCLPYKILFEKQYDKIHEDLLDEDKYLLIVLDAARHDYFEEEAKMVFKDYESIESVYSAGRNTFEYGRRIWGDGEFEAKYLSAAAPMNSVMSKEEAEKLNRFKGFVAGQHLEIVNLWKTHWNDEKGTVLPEDVRKETAKRLESEDKLVAHFEQPHAPYIGEKSKLGYKGEMVSEGKNAPDEYLWKKVLHGEITDQELRKLYRSNLKEALKEAKKLVEETEEDRRVVITSDHGELLGDGGIYEHKETNHPILRVIPWMEVQ
jgi:ribosomal protein L7/L12